MTNKQIMHMAFVFAGVIFVSASQGPGVGIGSAFFILALMP